VMLPLSSAIQASVMKTETVPTPQNAAECMLPAIDEETSSECTASPVRDRSPEASFRMPVSSYLQPWALPPAVEQVGLEDRLSKMESFMADMASTNVQLCASMEKRCLKTCFKMVNAMRDDLRQEMREAFAATESTAVDVVSSSRREIEIEGMASTIIERMGVMENTTVDLYQSMEKGCFEMVSAMREDLHQEMLETMAEMANQSEIEIERLIDQIDMTNVITMRHDERICNLISEAEDFRSELDEVNLQIEGPWAQTVSETSHTRDDFVQATMTHMSNMSKNLSHLHQQHDQDHNDSTTRLERLEKVTRSLQNERKASKSTFADDGSDNTSTDGTIRESEISLDSE